jgi:fructose-bisphosphate aldolase, class I
MAANTVNVVIVHGVVASFSHALVEELTALQTDAEFTAELDASIQSIFEASVA